MESGPLSHSTGNGIVSVTARAVGGYRVTFARSIARCTVLADISPGTTIYNGGIVTTGIADGHPDQLLVLDDRRADFDVSATCRE